MDFDERKRPEVTMIQIGSTIGYYRAKEYREDRKSKPVSIRGHWTEGSLLRIDDLPGIDFAITIEKPSYKNVVVRIEEISTGILVRKRLIEFSSTLELYEKIRLSLEYFEKDVMKREKGSIAVSIQRAGIINPEKVGKLIPLVKEESV